MNINYIIATFEGKTHTRLLDPNSENVLNINLDILYNNISKKTTKSLIKQITIMCPQVQGEKYHKYYNKKKWIPKFQSIGVQLIFEPCVNRYMSYDQWLLGYQKYPNFDYFILSEDDYCVDKNFSDFDNELVEYYKEKTKDNVGYICSLAWDVHHNVWHAGVSNGIISKETMEKLINPLEKFYALNDNQFGDQRGQLKFSALFTQNNIKLLDYTDKWRVLFWVSHNQKIVELNEKGNGHIFIPVQHYYNPKL